MPVFFRTVGIQNPTSIFFDNDSFYFLYSHPLTKSSNGFCETNDRNRFAKVMHMVNVTMRASLHEQFAADQVGGLGIQDQNF